MNKKQTLTERRALIQKVFTRLFERPEGATTKELVQGLEELDYTLLPCLHVLYVKIEGCRLPLGQLRAFADDLRRNIRSSIYLIASDQKSIIFLASTKGPELGTSEARKSWLKTLARAEAAGTIKVCMGVSSSFDDITMAKTYLLQAQKVCRTGQVFKTAPPIYFYDDYRIADVIASVTDKTALYSFRYPPLMRLIEHDTVKGTRYALTLYTYLQNPDDPAEVCRELFIHKNTLYFRLNKARSIMGCDFKTGTEILLIQFTFLLLDYEGKLEKKLEPLPSNKTRVKP